jgi:hypothetical protein
MRRRKGAITAFEGACLVAVLLGVFLFPTGQSKESSRRTAGLSHAKILAIALQMYCDDDNGIYPYVVHSKSLAPLLSQYLGPTVNTPGRGSYWDTCNRDQPATFEYNLSLGGVDRAKVEGIEWVPTFFDPYLRKSDQGDWQRLSGTTQGASKYVSITDWPRYRANLVLTFQPHGNPID